MAQRIQISFKDDETEADLFKYLMKKSEIIGPSAYLKTLLKQEKDKEKSLSEKG